MLQTTNVTLVYLLLQLSGLRDQIPYFVIQSSE